MKIKNNKLISEFSFENKDMNGNTTKTVVQVFKNGIVVINRFSVVPVKSKDYSDFKTIRTMFGKKVVFHVTGYKMATLKTIYTASMDQMIKAGVKLSDLV